MRTASIIMVGLAGITALLLVVRVWQDGSPVVAVGLTAVALMFMLWFGRRLLRRGAHSEWATAQRALADGQAVVLWKPGCGYCERLIAALEHHPRITWVNVHADRQANARVRELNGGDEYTPTVLIGDRVLRNPTADELQALLGEQPPN